MVKCSDQQGCRDKALVDKHQQHLDGLKAKLEARADRVIVSVAGGGHSDAVWKILTHEVDELTCMVWDYKVHLVGKLNEPDGSPWNTSWDQALEELNWVQAFMVKFRNHCSRNWTPGPTRVAGTQKMYCPRHQWPWTGSPRQ